MEGSLDQETRDNLSKSHSASKSLIYVINDLLDLTKTEEGGDLVKDEIFDIREVLREATDMFTGDARRKNISYDVTGHPDLPAQVIGDARRVRQAISNVTANAIQNTSEGGVSVNMSVTSRDGNHIEIEASVTDTGAGMDAKKLDGLFRELEQVQTEEEASKSMEGLMEPGTSLAQGGKPEEGRTLGLGLAVVSRILRNMNGQMRLKSEDGKGSRFVLVFPLDLPDTGQEQGTIEGESARTSDESSTPIAEAPHDQSPPLTPSNDNEEITLVERGSSKRSPDNRMARKTSNESFGSKYSMRSAKSGRSARSFKSTSSKDSQAERLIMAIQEPHNVDGWSGPGDRSSSIKSASASRPKLDHRHTTVGKFPMDTSTGSPMKPQRSNEMGFRIQPSNPASM
jgi:hypothetical protein